MYNSVENNLWGVILKKSRLDISLNVVFAILFVVLLVVFCITAKTFATSSGYSVTPVTLTGEYTTDKGDTFKLDSDHPFLNNNYKSITFKGKINAYVIPRHIVNLIMAVKKNYDEQLNYEKVQSELLKSRVTIMISQIQPLVENAVKHGVGMKEDGGTVTISTKEYDDRYEVVVSNDGVGFDTTKPNPDTSRTHLGIENIKERISTMCNGDVTIESEAGKGTVSTIKIFKDTKED